MTDIATRSPVDPLKGTLYQTKMIPGTSANTGITTQIESVAWTREPPKEVEFIIQAGSGPAWLEVMISDINRAAQFPQGWDSYGGNRLKEKAAIHAIELLQTMDFGGPAPWVSPTADGGIHLEWDRHGLGLEIEITEHGRVDVVTDDGEVREWTTGPFGDDELRLFLRQVTDVRSN
jgi:hypothetical protein